MVSKHKLWTAGGLTLAFGTAGLLLFGGNNSAEKPVLPTQESYTVFVDKVNRGEIKEVVLRNRVLMGEDTKGVKFKSYLPENENIVERTKDSDAEITALPPEPVKQPGKLWQLFLTLAPIVLIAGLIFGGIALMKRKKGEMGKAKLAKADRPKVRFDDVAGIEEAKQDLAEMVEYLRDPTQLSKLGGKAPTGALLVGPPGTGKTLIAKAVAGEAGVPFYSVSGSEFVEMYVGVGAARVRDLFAEAKKKAPCIIFIDEIDAVGKQRGTGGPGGGANDEREQTLNQILVEMDGFNGSEGIIVLAATNRSDVLDAALLRPGRFDRKIHVDLPTQASREKILAVHTKKLPLAADADLRVIARGTPGFSGADLANLCNEAALLAARLKRDAVTLSDFEFAKDKIIMGAENRSLGVSDEQKRLTAYHEAGHALIAAMSPESDPIHKATIVPRGGALGMVIRLSEGDKISMSRANLKADLAIAFGGREAEEMIFGHDKVTTGASADIQWATKVASRMVREWGMSEKLGARRFVSDEQREPISGETQKLIDSEIDALLSEAQKKAKQMLTEYNKDFHKIAEALIEYETLNGDEIRAMLRGEDIAVIKETARLLEKQANDNRRPPVANEENFDQKPRSRWSGFKFG